MTMGDEVLVGCGGDPLPGLQGAEWRVEDIGGGGIIDSAHVTLTFGADGRAFGAGGCNRWTGGYTTEGDALTFGPAAVTRMACPEALMNLEQAFLTALTQVATYRIDDSGALLLASADGTVVLTARR
jgi:heat shock protein HslJ